MALRCAREFHYRYVERIPESEVMPESRIGKAVHELLELVLTGTPLAEARTRARDRLQAERERRRFDALDAGVRAFLERVQGFRRRRRVSRELVEYSLAVREDFTPTSFYAPDAFYRGVFDAAFLYDDGTMALVDHKTGVRYPRLDIAEQLQGYAVLARATFRSVRRFWLGIHWVGDAEMQWAPPLPAAEVNRVLLPRLLDNVEAAALAVDDGPRPFPGDWCSVCSYRSICPAAARLHLEPVDEEPEPGVA
jgi:hypothetical protein